MLWAKQTISAMLSIRSNYNVHCNHPQHNLLPMHINMHRTTHYTAFHNPLLCEVAGSTPHWETWVLMSQRGYSGWSMPKIWLATIRLTNDVPLAAHLLLIMHWAAKREDFQPSVIMRFTISANLMSAVYHYVCVESLYHPLSWVIILHCQQKWCLLVFYISDYTSQNTLW